MLLHTPIVIHQFAQLWSWGWKWVYRCACIPCVLTHCWLTVQRFAAEADAVLLGDSVSARTTIRVNPGASQESSSAGGSSPHVFHVTGSPYTPKYYGSFQLQDEKHAGTWFSFDLDQGFWLVMFWRVQCPVCVRSFQECWLATKLDKGIRTEGSVLRLGDIFR